MMDIKFHPPGKHQRFPIVDIVKDNLYARLDIRGNEVYPTSVYYNPYFVPGFINQGCPFCEVAKLLNLSPEEWTQVRNFIFNNFGVDIGEYKLCAVVRPNVDLPGQPFHLLIAKVPGSSKNTYRMFVSVQTPDKKTIYAYIPENVENQWDTATKNYLKKLALIYSIDPTIKNTVEEYFQRFFNKPFPFNDVNALIERANEIQEKLNQLTTLKITSVRDVDIFKPSQKTQPTQIKPKIEESKKEKIEELKKEEVEKITIAESEGQGSVLTLLLIVVIVAISWYFFRRWF